MARTRVLQSKRTTEALLPLLMLVTIPVERGNQNNEKTTIADCLVEQMKQVRLQVTRLKVVFPESFGVILLG